SGFFGAAPRYPDDGCHRCRDDAGVRDWAGILESDGCGSAEQASCGDAELQRDKTKTEAAWRSEKIKEFHAPVGGNNTKHAAHDTVGRKCKPEECAHSCSSTFE